MKKIFFIFFLLFSVNSYATSFEGLVDKGYSYSGFIVEEGLDNDSPVDIQCTVYLQGFPTDTLKYVTHLVYANKILLGKRYGTIHGGETIVLSTKEFNLQAQKNSLLPWNRTLTYDLQEDITHDNGDNAALASLLVYHCQPMA